MRIRRRLTLYGFAVTTLTMLAFGLLLWGLARGSVPQEQDRNLASFADVLLATSPELDDPARVPGLPIPIDIDTSTDIYVAIYDADGTVLTSTGTVDGAAPQLPAAVIVEALDAGTSIATPQFDGVEMRVDLRRVTHADVQRDGLVLRAAGRRGDDHGRTARIVRCRR